MDKEDVVHIYKGILVIVVYWLSRVQLFVSARLLCPWDFPGNSTGVGWHFLLQGILPDPGIEPGSPALQADALTSDPPGKPRISPHWPLSILSSLRASGGPFVWSAWPVSLFFGF